MEEGKIGGGDGGPSIPNWTGRSRETPNPAKSETVLCPSLCPPSKIKVFRLGSPASSSCIGSLRAAPAHPM